MGRKGEKIERKKKVKVKEGRDEEAMEGGRRMRGGDRNPIEGKGEGRRGRKRGEE
jgi:hypothetical protein